MNLISSIDANAFVSEVDLCNPIRLSITSVAENIDSRATLSGQSTASLELSLRPKRQLHYVLRDLRACIDANRVQVSPILKVNRYSTMDLTVVNSQ